MVLSWLDDLGLGQYSSQCGRVITCGQDLLKASPAQLERDMGLKNPLHRKKLQLALQVHLARPYSFKNMFENETYVSECKTQFGKNALLVSLSEADNNITARKEINDINQVLSH